MSAELRHSSTILLERAEEKRKGYNHEVRASLILSAFTFEASLNHIGSKVVRHWPEIDRLSWKKKLIILSKECGFEVDFSKSPFQTINTLFTYRNALAHGRTEEDEDYTIREYDDGKDFRVMEDLKPKWQDYESLESSRRAHDAVEQGIDYILEYSGSKGHPFVHGLITQGSSVLNEK